MVAIVVWQSWPLPQSSEQTGADRAHWELPELPEDEPLDEEPLDEERLAPPLPPVPDLESITALPPQAITNANAEISSFFIGHATRVAFSGRGYDA